MPEWEIVKLFLWTQFEDGKLVVKLGVDYPDPGLLLNPGWDERGELPRYAERVA